MDPLEADPQRRVVVRYRLPDGRATDALGTVVEVTPDAVIIGTRAGGRVRVARAAVIMAKAVPAVSRGPAPARTSAAELERLAALAWADHAEPLGQWWLRSADGFTGRANSCCAVGDPGRPLVDAARAVIDFADRHGIAPLAQVIMDSEEDTGLGQLGWTPTYATVEVLAHRLSDLVPDSAAPHVIISPEVTEPWLSAYQAHRPGPEPTVRRLLSGGALAMITDPDGAVIAIGRGHHAGAWVGVAALWTDPDHRRRGLATAITAELGRWAAQRGARNAYLQVDRANTAALAAYARLGFGPHHTYRYLAPPQAEQRTRSVGA